MNECLHNGPCNPSVLLCRLHPENATTVEPKDDNRTMSYLAHLTEVFPWCFTSNRTTIRYFVRQLIQVDREDKSTVPNGSSFAVTTDPGPGLWSLWMSDATKNYLVAHMPHIQRNLIHTQDEEDDDSNNNH